MSLDETTKDDAPAPTQSQLYDDLRRIGQLEDQKYAIQQEIEQRTARLRACIPTLDKESLLFKMLSTSLEAKPKSKRDTPKRNKSKRK